MSGLRNKCSRKRALRGSKMPDLMAMQAKSRERHGVYDAISEPKKPVKTPPTAIDPKKLADAAKKAVIKPKAQQIPQESSFKRPPAEYGNTSPYGIWAQMAREQLAKN